MDALEALYAGDVERARELLPPDGELSVFEAAAFGRVQRLAEILEGEPALAGAISDDGFTPLHLAIFGDQSEAARLLIERGADLNAVSTASFAQVPPLGTAAFVRSVELAELLLASGADVNARSSGDLTALDTAYANDDAPMIRLLESHGGVRGGA